MMLNTKNFTHKEHMHNRKLQTQGGDAKNSKFNKQKSDKIRSYGNSITSMQTEHVKPVNNYHNDTPGLVN